MKRLLIQHTTHYDYPSPVRLGPHELLIRPRSGHDVRIEASTLHIDPQPAIVWKRDLYGNSIAHLDFQDANVLSLNIASELTVQQFDFEDTHLEISDVAQNWPFVYSIKERLDLVPFQTPSFFRDQDAVEAWLAGIQCEQSEWQTADLLARLCRETAEQFNYAMREEAGVQTPSDTLFKRGGSCRDYATLFIEACRFLGMAARFVSGYLYEPSTPEGHGATHAWSEVYLPGLGWRGFDNTSGRLTGPHHIATAIARHPEMIPPVAGTFVGPAGIFPTMTVNVRVNELV